LANPAIPPSDLTLLVDQFRAKGATDFQAADEYNVFKYMVWLEKDSRTEWLMQFYNWAVFMTWTLPLNEIASGDTGMPVLHTLDLY
jgi:hypothetical protein